MTLSSLAGRGQMMSYGKGAGEPYISSLTLAFLEDTGHYRLNYSAVGRFVTDLETAGQCADEANTAYLDYIFGNDQRTHVRLMVALVYEAAFVFQ